MLKKLGISLVLGLCFSGAYAFSEPRPVPMTASGVYAFQSAMPEPQVIERGTHNAVAERCPQGCYVPSVPASKGMATYMDGLFDYYGYDYGATVYDYTKAMVGPDRLDDRELGMAVQQTQLEDFLNVAIGLIQVGEADFLVENGMVSPQQAHDLRILLEPGYYESLK